MYKIYVFIIAYLLLLDASLFYAPAQQVDTSAAGRFTIEPTGTTVALYIPVHGVEYVDEKSERSVNIYILCLSGH